MPEYKATLSSARACAEAGKTDVWVHRYLNGEGRNAPFSEGLRLCKRYYVGPARFPLRLFRRITGPEAEMPYRVDAGGWAGRVAGLEAAVRQDPDLPPLIVHYVDGDFELNDGNHRWQAYQKCRHRKRLGDRLDHGGGGEGGLFRPVWGICAGLRGRARIGGRFVRRQNGG